MRKRLKNTLAPVALLVGLCGASQASIITETITGTITNANLNGGLVGGPSGVNDFTSFFGGGNLFGDQVTVTFSLDSSLLEINPAYIADFPPSSIYTPTSSFAIDTSVTIGSYSYVANGDNVNTTLSVEYCAASNTCNQPSSAVALANTATPSMLSILNQPSTGGNVIQLAFWGNVNAGNIFDQTDMNLFASNLYAGGFTISNSQSTQSELFYFTNASVEQVATPEPATAGLLAMTLIGLIAFRARRRMNRFRTGISPQDSRP